MHRHFIFYEAAATWAKKLAKHWLIINETSRITNQRI